MSHKIYTTEAIVCGNRINNTSDKAFLLFTREAGMLWATARSVREEKSRQRYALQDFALLRVSLVRGKAGWRVGSAEGEVNFFTSASSQPARATVTNIVRLLRQFLHGEQAIPDIFDDTKIALQQGNTSENKSIQDIFSLRLLHKLGYIASSSEVSDYLNSEEWWLLPPISDKIRAAIEKAKQVSHL